MLSGAPHRFRRPRPHRLVDDPNAEVFAQTAINRMPGGIGLDRLEHLVDNVFGVWRWKCRQDFVDESLYAFGSIRHGLFSARKPPDKNRLAKEVPEERPQDSIT